MLSQRRTKKFQSETKLKILGAEWTKGFKLRLIARTGVAEAELSHVGHLESE